MLYAKINAISASNLDSNLVCLDAQGKTAPKSGTDSDIGQLRKVLKTPDICSIRIKRQANYLQRPAFPICNVRTCPS